MPVKSIGEVLKSHTDKLMALTGVVGVAEGRSKGKPIILVFVARKNPELLKIIPDAINGYKVVVEESGDFHAT